MIVIDDGTVISQELAAAYTEARLAFRATETPIGTLNEKEDNA